MKKLLTLIAFFVLTACILLLLVGCREQSDCSHEWSEPNVVDAPTCVKGGYSISTCTKCGESTRTILYPSDHPYSSEWSHDGSYHWRDATCQHKGQTTDYAPHEFEGKYCISCGAVKATQGLLYRADIENGTYIVTDVGTTLETDIVIARYYNGKDIVAVGDSAFANSRGIKSIYLQEYIITVGNLAFANSLELTEVTLSNGLTYMGSCLFIGCDSLTTVVFRGTVDEFNAIEKAGDWDGGNTGFVVKCNDGIVTPPRHTYSEEWSYDNNYHWRVDTCGHDALIVDYGAHTFDGSTCTGCGIVRATQGLSYRGDLTTGTYVVNGMGTTLDSEIVVARYYNNVEITAVGDLAFSDVAGLKSVYLQKYILRVGDRAFADSADLETVTLTKGLEYLGSELFSGCESLTTVVFHGTVAEFDAIEKAEDWDAGHSGYTIKCFDGNITK